MDITGIILLVLIILSIWILARDDDYDKLLNKYNDNKINDIPPFQISNKFPSGDLNKVKKMREFENKTKTLFSNFDKGGQIMEVNKHSYQQYKQEVEKYKRQFEKSLVLAASSSYSQQYNELNPNSASDVWGESVILPLAQGKRLYLSRKQMDFIVKVLKSEYGTDFLGDSKRNKLADILDKRWYNSTDEKLFLKNIREQYIIYNTLKLK